MQTIKREEILNLISNLDLEGLSKVETYLTDIDKKVILSKLNDVKSIGYALSYFHFLSTDDRKNLIKKCENELYELISNNLDVLYDEEISYIIKVLCDNQNIIVIFKMIGEFKYLISSNDIDNIVQLFITKNNDPWEIINLLKTLQFQLSNQNITSIINCLCNIKCIDSLICLLIDFNKLLTHQDVINIITTIFNNDKKGLYLSELVNCIDYSILNDDDMKFIIDKVCILENEDCIPRLIYYISSKLDSNLINYTVSKLYELNRITTSMTTILINNFMEHLNSNSVSLIIKSICNLGQDRYLTIVADKLKNVMSEEDINDIINAICKTKVPYYIIEISKILSSDLNKIQIEFIGETLCEIDNIKFLYQFISIFDGKMSDELKNKIRQQILNSKEFKYIILFAIFIDVTLIEILFSDIENMYIFIISSRLFNLEELNLINEKLNIKPQEPNIEKALKLLNNNINAK